MKSALSDLVSLPRLLDVVLQATGNEKGVEKTIKAQISRFGCKSGFSWESYLIQLAPKVPMQEGRKAANAVSTRPNICRKFRMGKSR